MFFDIGLGIGGRSNAPLNFTMKIKFPVLHPAGAPESNSLGSDVDPL